MTLPLSGAISFNNIADELVVSHTNFSISGAAARALAGVPTGPIAMADFYGKGSLSATVSPDVAAGTDPTNTHSTVTSNTVTAAGHGGSGSYTYSWARKSGDAGITATSPTGAVSAFSCTTMASNSERAAVFTCTVSDGTSTAPVDVSVDLTRGSP